MNTDDRQDGTDSMKVQDAVKKETGFVGAGTAAASIVMLSIFAVLHRFIPESVPFGLREIVSAVIGCAVATGNFFMMGMTVQKVVNEQSDDNARNMMKVSYRNRTLMQLVWVVIALVVPALNAAAGIIPLFIPSFLIKARGIFGAAGKGKGM